MSNIDYNYQTSGFVRDNIVKIVDNKGQFYGTGFLIDINHEYFCITCHHCIYRIKEIFFEKDDNSISCEWIGEYSDMCQDISVLKPKDSNISVKPLEYNLQVMPKLKVFLWGFSSKNIENFPSGSPVENGILSQDYITFRWPEGQSSGNNIWNIKPEVYLNVYQFDGKVDLGYSGAPVCYDGNKKVIGIFTAKDNNYGYVIPIETLLSKFNKNILMMPSSNKDIKDLLEKGNKYYYKRQYQEAISFYDEIIKDSNYLSALSNKGRAYAQVGRTKESIEIFNLVLSLDPNFIFALIGMDLVHSKLGSLEESIKWYDKALAINPNFDSAINNKGVTLYRWQKYGETETLFDKALAINPNFDLALRGKGSALYK